MNVDINTVSISGLGESTHNLQDTIPDNGFANRVYIILQDCLMNLWQTIAPGPDLTSRLIVVLCGLSTIGIICYGSYELLNIISVSLTVPRAATGSIILFWLVAIIRARHTCLSQTD